MCACFQPKLEGKRVCSGSILHSTGWRKLEIRSNQTRLLASSSAQIGPQHLGGKSYRAWLKKCISTPPGTLLFEDEQGKTQAPTRWGVLILYINPNVAEPKTVRVLSGCRETSLRIPVRLLAGDDEVTPICPALIETGAEICVLKRGLIPDQYLRPATKPLRLVGANERRLEGGDKEVTLNLCVGAIQQEDNKKVELRVPKTFYVADIKDPLILSYEWCRQRGFVFTRFFYSGEADIF